MTVLVALEYSRAYSLQKGRGKGLKVAYLFIRPSIVKAMPSTSLSIRWDDDQRRLFSLSWGAAGRSDDGVPSQERVHVSLKASKVAGTTADVNNCEDYKVISFPANRHTSLDQSRT